MEHTEEEELVDFASSVTNKGLPSPPSSPPLPNLIDHLPTTETLDEKFQNLGLEEKEKPVEEVELGDHDRKGQDEEEKKEPVEEEEGDHNRKEGDVIVNGRKEDENSVENLDLNEFSKDVLEEDDKEKDNLDVNGQSKENPEEEEKVYPEGDENYNGKEKENPQGDENWNGNEKENHEQENWNVSEKENPWNENDNPVEHENWNHNDYPQGGENWNPNDYPQGGENWNQNDYLEGGETVGTEQKNGRFQYPLRPGEPDCTYYLRTGTCRYGLNCRFNHPTRRKRQARSPSKRSPSMRSPSNSEEPFQTFKDNEEYSERNGQQECKYYLRTGGCKFGKACRYDHSRDKTANEPAAEFNFLGLPIRPGEKECPFYMRTGSCKFAINCRFHHPDPTAAGGSDSGYNKNGSLPLHSSGESQPAGSSWSAPRPSNAAVPYLDTSPSYVPMMLTPPQGLHSTLEWNGYQASPVMPLYPPKGNVRPPMAAPPMPPVLNDPTKNSDGFGHHQGMPVDEFPERPGQKECQYFMKTGDCKYKSACRFHHPKNRIPKTNALSPMGLPLRPDQIICTHYSRYGICKFGPACKYDHPPNIGSPTFPGGGPMAPMPFDNSANFGGSVQQSV